MGNNLENHIEILRKFKKYEDTFYSYLYVKDNYKEINDLTFFLISKNYISSIIDVLKYKNNIDDLNQLNIYYDSNENKEEMEEIIKMIKSQYINNNFKEFKFKIDKVKNKKMFKPNNKKELKLDEEGLFIPLIFNSWIEIKELYGCDEEVERKGFLNNGEVSIITEDNKRIDTFFVHQSTGDIIYHFCFFGDKFKKLISYLKKKSIKSLLDNLGINF
jgi:hypothetical protein